MGTLVHREPRGSDPSIFDVPFETVADWPEIAERIAAEQPTFSGREQVLNDLYASITHRVEPIERALIVQGEGVLADLNGRLREMRTLADELLGVAEMADDGEEVNLDVFASTDNRARALLSKPNTLAASAEKVAGNLDSPLDALADMERRMPVLRRKPFTA